MLSMNFAANFGEGVIFIPFDSIFECGAALVIFLRVPRFRLQRKGVLLSTAKQPGQQLSRSVRSISDTVRAETHTVAPN